MCVCVIFPSGSGSDYQVMQMSIGLSSWEHLNLPLKLFRELNYWVACLTHSCLLYLTDTGTDFVMSCKVSESVGATVPAVSRWHHYLWLWGSVKQELWWWWVHRQIVTFGNNADLNLQPLRVWKVMYESSLTKRGGVPWGLAKDDAKLHISPNKNKAILINKCINYAFNHNRRNKQ